MGPIEGLGKDGKAIHYLGDEVVCCCCCTQSSLGSVGYLEAGNPSQDPLFQGSMCSGPPLVPQTPEKHQAET